MLALFSPILYAAEKHNADQCQPYITQRYIAQATEKQTDMPPQQGWKVVSSFPDFVHTHWDNYHGNVWYKIHWRADCLQQNDPLHLVIGHLNMAGKVYLNQDLLWQDQSLVEPISRSWNTPRVFNLLASSVHTDQDNVLWVYLVNSPTQPASLGAVHIGTYQSIAPYFNEYHLEQRTLIIIAVIMNVTIGIFYFMVWLIYRKENAYLWISATVVLWLLYSVLFLAQNPPFDSNTFDRLITSVFSAYTIISCIALWRFAKRHFPRIEKILWFLFIVINLTLIFVPSQILATTLTLIFIINMVIFLALNLSFPYIAYKNKQIEVYVMAALHLIFIPVALHDAYQILTHQTQFWSPYISPLSALTLGVLLGMRLYRSKLLIEGFNKTLTEKINTVTQELSTSLNAQHQLALENTRLQERINLSHDLHDGLGGSLVRSIELVSKNNTLGQDNFLSILKLLRSDLRQIIDYGSSLGTKIPASPIMWAAPIRHRYVQIFEELDIRSEWVLSNVWKKTPTNLECLTLTRIAEEALTNIIKHSHAHSVKVSLIETQQQRILEIMDDGVGFDPAHVQEGIHVGMQSMKIRTDRIGGTFEIESETGCTLIRITL